MDAHFSLYIGAFLAFLFAAITVLYDCHVSIQDRLKRVPMPIFKAPQAVLLAVCCGIVALIAFNFTDGKGDTVVDSLLSLKQTNPYLRGLSVGLTILVLIRSKISNIDKSRLHASLPSSSAQRS